MMIDRRSFVAASLLVGTQIGYSKPSVAQILPRVPNPSNFRRGDFVWPKKPGAFVPYNSNADDSPDADRKRWLAEREKLLNKAREGKIDNAQAIEGELRNLSYEAFQTRYINDKIPGQFIPYADGGVAAVGHIGLVDIDRSGKPYVIEALWKLGISRTSYADWLKQRPGQIVWHGRLSGKDQFDRAKIVDQAMRQVGKPYDFWNFNLDDDRGFYCSKLVWQSVFRGLGIGIDGNANPARSFWLSPKQILNAKLIEKLHDPGDYGKQ